MVKVDKQNKKNQKEDSDLVDKLVGINRVAKVVEDLVLQQLWLWVT